MNRPKYRQFTMRIDFDTLNWLRDFAKRQRSNMSEIIYEQLGELKKKDKQKGGAMGSESAAT